MKTIKDSHPSGMTLVEILVSMTILTMVAAATVAGLIQNRYLTESNIYENTAFNVSRGYLEQMFGMQFDELKQAADALTDASTTLAPLGGSINFSGISDSSVLTALESIKIDTKGVDSSASSSGSVTVDRPLYCGMWIEQSVLIDIVDPLGQKGAPKEVTTLMKFKPSISNLDDGSNNDINAVEISLEYQYQTRERGGLVWKTGRTLKMIRADVPVF